MRQQLIGNRRPFGTQRVDGMAEIDGVPQGDRGHDQIEAAGAVPLVLIGPVADFTQPVEAHGARA